MQRARGEELMDQPGLDWDEYRQCLRQLETINRLSLGYRPTLRWLDRVAWGRATLSVLDLGSGHGDTLRAIARWGARRGVALRLTGLDLSPMAARAAREATPPDMAIEWVAGDAFAWDPPEPPDVVISALFMHHLEEAQVVALLRRIDAVARIGWFVNDLHRHWLPWAFLSGAFALPGVNRIVRHDGPLSVKRAFTRAEWAAMCAQAGVAARVEWHAPFRWGVSSHGG